MYRSQRMDQSGEHWCPPDQFSMTYVAEIISVPAWQNKIVTNAVTVNFQLTQASSPVVRGN